MGKRSRRRAAVGAGPAQLTAPTSTYTDADADGSALTLRGALSPATRREYADVLAGRDRSAGTGGRAASTREDEWQRATELLFERLVVSWTIAGAPIERQHELLARYRAASSGERAWVRDVLREHCAEHFPDVQAP